MEGYHIHWHYVENNSKNTTIINYGTIVNNTGNNNNIGYPANIKEEKPIVKNTEKVKDGSLIGVIIKVLATLFLFGNGHH